jgi:hypothetical protein
MFEAVRRYTASMVTSSVVPSYSISAVGEVTPEAPDTEK